MTINNHHRALIALLQVPEFGARRAKILLQKTGVDSAEDLFKLKLPDLLRIDGFGEQISLKLAEFDDWEKVDSILEKTEKSGARLIAVDEEQYPELLRQIYDPPPVIWVKGDLSVLNQPGIAVIGTRQPGPYGVKQAEWWTEKLVQKGICINSGLAYGVDAKAHQAALNNSGKTIAVLGSGIDVMYPAKNSRLATQIIESGGAVITEYPPGSAPDAGNFPERNRIVSGMSHGVLVIESGIKGGSMITARCALDQNREVFVVPHPLGYMKGEGCNYLIRTGQGKLVQSVRDILDEVSISEDENRSTDKPQKQSWKELDLPDEAVQICSLLENDALHIDQLSETLKKPTFKLLPLLLDLEMQGAIKQKAGKYFELC